MLIKITPIVRVNIFFSQLLFISPLNGVEIGKDKEDTVNAV